MGRCTKWCDVRTQTMQHIAACHDALLCTSLELRLVIMAALELDLDAHLKCRIGAACLLATSEDRCLDYMSPGCAVLRFHQFHGTAPFHIGY